MRGKVKLDKRAHVLGKNGFPIVFYISQDKKDKRINTGFYAFEKEWDTIGALPTPLHPQYLDVLNYLEIAKIRLAKLLHRSKIETITFYEAEKILKNESQGTFYADAAAYLKAHPMHESYRLALKAFNDVYPDIDCSHITKDIAVSFTQILLKTPTKQGARSSNGVNAYMTRLGFLWRQVSQLPSPFKGVRLKPQETPNKALNDEDIKKLQGANFKKHYNTRYGGMQNYVNYWLLCFYLGGIDLVDLVELREHNIVGGRIEFYRAKGNSKVFVSNKILPPAQALLDLYTGKNKDLLIPVERRNLVNFHTYIYKKREEIQGSLTLSRKLYTKSARYTFINRAMNLLIDERICAEIVGHKEQTTHAIYKGKFPNAVKDAAHERIITL